MQPLIQQKTYFQTTARFAPQIERSQKLPSASEKFIGMNSGTFSYDVI